MQFQEDSHICAFVSQRTVFADGVRPATLVVSDEKIQEILYDTSEDVVRYLSQKYPGIPFNDCGSLVLMPGIIDSHVHVNEPGRTEWEGFHTATRAAAAGGVTTIADMPLNSIPPTTTLDNLKTKAREAYAKSFVDVAFWGGVIPGNQFHAECEELEKTNPLTDPGLYNTFLHTRPDLMELKAVKLICDWCIKYNVRCHIVHLSSAKCLALINDAKTRGAPLTVETCYHYLILAAEEIPEGSTEFKCCPPIRGKNNREQLWHGIKNGTLDMVVSDHSPCVPELKTRGNFLTAWGGISSLQFGLPLIWTAARTRNISFSDISKLLSKQPARLCGLEDRKGDLFVGMDADFIIWDPEESIKVEVDDIYYKNKLTPYQGKILFGKTIATVLRGRFVFKEGKVCDKPVGKLLLHASILQTIET
ncbi:allantoinase, mitochondrial isoform X3 [Monomorium pharaonis]|uniref:allantoinase, mitochondrial isoform X3 n=1 Tax=Monomorium pharaonis TaxID=307658 RepID=UPI001745D7C9|nr:allantoinase, mitochondrial isoform X3 [Monomorium pharaonis]